jgi:hypothetical protein
MKFRIGEPVGEGAHKNVYKDADHPDKVIAIRKELEKDSPELERTIKARFYLTKILHILFPENIPDIDLATSDPQATRREKVEHDLNHATLQEWVKNTLEHLKSGSLFPPKKLEEQSRVAAAVNEDPKLQKLLSSLNKLGVEIDFTSINFTHDNRGNIVYVDDIHLWDADWETENPMGYDAKKLLAAIEKVEDSQTRERALVYFERLKTLTDEQFNGQSRAATGF